MRILVAEDDEIHREIICEILSQEGHSVISVDNGEDLIKFALEDKPQLIITDIRMPKVSGDAVVAMIKEHKELSDIPVIVTTGISPQQVWFLGIPQDVMVLFKPIEPQKLKEVISKYAKILLKNDSL